MTNTGRTTQTSEVTMSTTQPTVPAHLLEAHYARRTTDNLLCALRVERRRVEVTTSEASRQVGRENVANLTAELVRRGAL